MTRRDSTPQLTVAVDHALALAGLHSPGVSCAGDGGLPSYFDVTGLAATSIGAACAEISALANPHATAADTLVDARLASFWFGMSIAPQGWELPPVWDAIAGLYETADGWIRLHTNAAQHKAAALRVLDCTPHRDSVASAVGRWTGTALETAIVDAGGCAAEMRAAAAWGTHPQGAAVAGEPLIAWKRTGGDARPFAVSRDRPLRGLRVLDLTRVLAGPVATRFLAAFGAEVLRIDPPGWEEGAVVPEVTLGKRCATLDLKTAAGRGTFLSLLAEADVLVHGYRPDALARLGLGDDERRGHNPQLIDVALSAYGWCGPWAQRRGFDSLVQMSCGIAEAGMQRSTAQQPTPLPVQALDHATGYLMAAAILRALRVRNAAGDAHSARLSLARTAGLLLETLSEDTPSPLAELAPEDYAEPLESTSWGPARRLRFPAIITGAPPGWTSPAHALHTDAARWISR